MANIITLAEYKSFVGLTKTDQDSKLNLLITAASNLVKTYLNHLFPSTSPIVEYICVDYDTNVLYPTYWPIRDVISVEESARYTTDSTVHVPLQHGSDFYVSGDTIIRLPGSLGFASWPLSPSTVIVTYEAGYDTTYPEELKLATIELVNYYLNKEFVPTRTLQGATIVNAGSGIADLPAHVRAILDYYRD